MPAVTTMVDAKGNTIAWLYSQRRFEVPSDQIADTMKLAIVSIEDKRFAEHNGVDWKGTLTGLAGYASGDVDTRGGSTIEQQYVKNYHLLVIAQTDAEKRAAVETTPARKLREIRMALTLDKTLTKPEILTRYLNLVSFGNGAFGIQDAAQTYFGIDASALNWQQAALLAGLVQSTSTLNPYTNPDGALARRNLVLDTMIENLPDKADELRAAKQQPLGILPQPNELPQGCIAAGDRAFFCDYVLEYLARAGISKDAGRPQRLPDQDHAGSRRAELASRQAIDSWRQPDLDGVASVMSVILPGKTAHPVLAMGDNRDYGLQHRRRPNRSAATVLAGRRRRRVDLQDLHHRRGAGHGHGHQRQPRRARRASRPRAWAAAAPRAARKDTWCVKNAGDYRGLDERHRRAGAVAQHRVRQADLAGRGAAHGRHGGQARACGPTPSRAPPAPTTRRTTRAWPTSSSGRTSARSRWARSRSTRSSCPTSRPRWPPAACGARPTRSTRSSTAAATRSPSTAETCEQVVPEGLANTLSNALSKDATSGTARRLGRLGRLEPADVGQDRHHRGAPVVRLPRLHQPLRRGELHLRRLARTRRTCAPGRCASAATATSTAATSRPRPGSPR